MLYDIHIPYQDNTPLEMAIEYGKKMQCDSIFLGGDTIDCHLLSDYVKDPDARDFAEELDLTKSFFAYLRQEFPDAHIYFKEGNHEHRYWRYMRVKAPELVNVGALSLPNLLELDTYRISWVHGKTKALVKGLSIFHGHEFGRTIFSPVNPARGLYLRAKATAIAGHSHQTSEHNSRNVNEKMTTCWTSGCLSNLSPEYKPYNEWNHGFIYIEKTDYGFHVENKRIQEGRFM